MKTTVLIVLALAGVMVLATAAYVRHLNERHAEQLAHARAAWQQERRELESALNEASSRPRLVTVPGAAAEPVVVTAATSPREVLERLRQICMSPGGREGRELRQVIQCLEELSQAGPSALPHIRDFLAVNEDVDFVWPDQNRRRRPYTVPDTFVLPPSLRFGLFDVVKRMGGEEASLVLGEVLSRTGRGVELYWLARALQSMTPNQYRDTAIASARELLNQPLAAESSSPLDRDDRDNLFGVLALYGDTSYTDQARDQLVQAEGRLDRSALRYLQETLGAQSVTIAAQTYQDPRLTDPAQREPLVRLALAYVGADAQADAFYAAAVADLTLTESHRSNLIEDLNEDGFADPDNLQPTDLAMIRNRLALIEQLAPQETDPINTAAFQEAYKDLVNMRNRLVAPAAGP